MPFLSWLSEPALTWQKPLRQVLASVTSRLTATTAHGLDDFFREIGHDLALKNIGLFFVLLDEKAKTIEIKNHSLPQNFSNEHPLVRRKDKTLTLAAYPDYLAVWREKKPTWLEAKNSIITDGFDFQGAKRPSHLSSIVVPLVIGDEAVGMVEYFATDIKRSDIPTFDDFSRELTHSLVDYLLFGEIKKTEERYRLLFTEAGEGFAVIDGHTGLIIRANKSLSVLTGMALDDLAGLDYRRLFDQHEKLTIERLVAACTLGRDKNCVSRMEACLITTKKECRTVLLTINQIGQTREYLFIFNDITAQKRAAEEIRRLNEFNQHIFNASPISILVLDRKGIIIAANDHARALMAGTHKKLIGLKLTDTEGFKEQRQLKGLFEQMLANGSPIYYDNLSYKEDGNGGKRHLNIIAVPLLDANGGIEGAISMAVDNTEIVKARERLESLNRDLEDRVASRTAELDAANRRLNEALELKLKFIADASHELRTPLTVLQGNFELAIREFASEKSSLIEVFSLGLVEIARMSHIISDLTMLTNIDSETERLRFEALDLAILVKTASDSVRVLADQKHIKISFDSSPRSVIYEGDESWLEKLFINLIRNAIKYSNENGRVNITIRRQDNEAQIAVTDKGIGIPMEDQARIFERFYRVDKSRSRHEGGTGLGLAIAKWVAETHGGRITLASEVGKGSTFTVHLPLIKRT